MAELLFLENRVRNGLALGESHVREFKSALEGKPGAKRPRRVGSILADIREALVAFANADGGELFIGVEDDGSVTGVPHPPDELAQLLDAPKSGILGGAALPVTAARSLVIDEQRILFFSVTKGTERVYQLADGRCMRRRDLGSVPAVFEELVFARAESRSRGYDRDFIDGASAADLDVSRISAEASRLFLGMSPEAFLQQLGLAEFDGEAGLRLRRAAVLLFAKDVARWQLRSEVRLLQVDGTEQRTGTAYNVVRDQTIEGNILLLREKTWEALRSWITERPGLDSDMRFSQHYTFPEASCHEAILNAIVHRDYVSQAPVEIRIFSNRLEVRSPGPLLSTVSIKAIQAGEGVHESRNALIARTLREIGYMRELGEGLRRIYETASAREEKAPALYSNGSFFAVSLFRASSLSDEERTWLEPFGALAVEQRRILLAGRDGKPLSARQIQRAIGTEVLEQYNQHMKVLREAGFLVETAKAAAREGLAKRELPRFVVQRPQR